MSDATDQLTPPPAPSVEAPSVEAPAVEAPSAAADPKPVTKKKVSKKKAVEVHTPATIVVQPANPYMLVNPYTQVRHYPDRPLRVELDRWTAAQVKGGVLKEVEL